MAGLWQKTLVYLGLADDEKYEEDFEEEELDEEEQDKNSASTVRKVRRYPDMDRVRKQTTALRTVSPPHVKVHIVEPSSFNDCQLIADKFKGDVPVIMNLQISDKDLSKRLVDFASGLTYGLDGGMQKIAEKVFLLTPSNVEVSAEEKRRLQERGLFNQL